MAERSSPTLIPLFVTPLEAAHLLGLSRTEVYKLLDTKVLRGARYGSRRLVVLASVHEYADSLTEPREA